MCYDFSVALDPAFRDGMKKMIVQTVKASDHTLDIGCGTGISSFYAAAIARQVTAIDPSADMLAKFEKKLTSRQPSNIQLIHGSFPQGMPKNVTYDSIVTSFAIVHFTPEQRKTVYKDIYDLLATGGKLGMFAAQGEIASSFETKEEVEANLIAASFQKVETIDLSDVYRIVSAEKA